MIDNNIIMLDKSALFNPIAPLILRGDGNNNYNLLLDKGSLFNPVFPLTLTPSATTTGNYDLSIVTSGFQPVFGITVPATGQVQLFNTTLNSLQAIAPGSGISLTTSSDGKYTTIAATGNYQPVFGITVPTAGQVQLFNSTLNAFQALAPGAGISLTTSPDGHYTTIAPTGNYQPVFGITVPTAGQVQLFNSTLNAFQALAPGAGISLTTSPDGHYTTIAATGNYQPVFGITVPAAGQV